MGRERQICRLGLVEELEFLAVEEEETHLPTDVNLCKARIRAIFVGIGIVVFLSFNQIESSISYVYGSSRMSEVTTHRRALIRSAKAADKGKKALNHQFTSMKITFLWRG